MFVLNILLALLVLNIMVIAHELGHYLFARRNGIGVHEFAVGFGPTLLKKKWRGTMWLLKAIPLGGYNGLKGEMEAEDEGKGNFATARKWAKLQVLFAGSLMNVVMAILAFYIALALYGWKVPVPLEFNPIGAVLVPVGGVENEYPMVTAIGENSPMSKIEVKLPFSVVSVNGQITRKPEDVVKQVSSAVSDEIVLSIIEGQSQRVIKVTRDENKRIGINIASAPIELVYNTTSLHVATSGFSHAANMTVLTGKMLGMLISFTAKTGDLEPLGYAFAGPVAIVAAVGSVVKDSKTIVADLANMTGLIGVSLALFNLLPFPGLDGWHIFLLFYEKARGRKPNQKLVGIVTAIGLFFLLSLGAVIMLKDVWLFFLKK